MSYLDKAGLTRLWAHILEKFKTVENKIPEVDNTLSTTGMAADAKAVGDALANIDVQDEIYIGSGEFPEGYTVQIDPTGEVEENITVDNTVTVGSTNAVSSAAVIAYIEERLAAIPSYNEVSV